jgi:hypothetical protein
MSMLMNLYNKSTLGSILKTLRRVSTSHVPGDEVICNGTQVSKNDYKMTTQEPVRSH